MLLGLRIFGHLVNVLTIVSHFVGHIVAHFATKFEEKRPRTHKQSPRATATTFGHYSFYYQIV
jgi:hypothetical protein